jgi:hypothetical protein
MMIARTRSVAAFAVAGIAAILASAPASAQSPEAETLFREGKRLLKQGDIAEACDKFEASDRLEPSAGTKLNLADCREKNGQLATAWSTFIKAASAAKRTDKDGKREAEARKRAAALEPRLVHLTIKVTDDSRVDGLTIKRNDAAVDEELWNQRVPIDPDEYTITAEAPGHEPWTQKIAIRKKDKSIEVPRLEPAEETANTDSTSKSDDADEKPERDDDDADDDRKSKRRKKVRTESPSTFTGLRKGAIAFAVVGLAAGGAGIAYGVRANDLSDQSDAICPDTSCSDAHGVDLNKQARRSALFANIGFAAGGAFVATAVVMWIVGAPSEPRAERVTVTPTVGSEQLGFAVGGRF